MFEDVITLGQGHSIMAGHIPNKISGKGFSEKFFESSKAIETLESFGLFGSDLNYNTYYPDVKPEDLVPTDEEFIEPIYRMLSAGIVARNWSPVDFSKNGVLKSSMNLLIGQTVNCDHETNIGNAIGSVKEVYWQEAYSTNRDGRSITVPAGINAKLKIDAKANPRIARGILMDPPSIHSNSVTIRFMWEKSHPKLSDADFWDQFGRIGSDGRLICKVASNIIGYYETSLVSHGADPFAQKVDENGKIVNPVHAANQANSYSDRVGRNWYFFTDFKDITKAEVLHNTMVFNNAINNGPRDQNNKTQENMDELKEFLQSLFGENLLSLGENKEATKELALSAIKELIASEKTTKESLSAITTERDNLKTELQGLKDQIEKDKPMVTIGTQHLSDVREKVTSDYKKLMGEDKIDESMITLLSNADLTTLTSLGKTYTSQLEDKFPMKCSDCGSHNVSRASSVTEDTTENKDKDKNQSPKDTSEALRSLRLKKRNEQNQ